MMDMERLTVTCSAFGSGEPIPRRHAYTGEGDNVPPPISWDGVPPGTMEIAVICEDPDAPLPQPWIHWVLYGILPEATSVPPEATPGLNSWGKPGWGGPMPPKGHGVHHYHFHVYALAARTGIPRGADANRLRRVIVGKVLAAGELVGTYQR